jgi:ABC-2 type transport system ATP-binding protein
MGTGVSIGALLRVLTLVALACAITAPPASAAEPAKTALTFDVMVGPGNDVPCTITADLYTPAGASKDHPVPAVMGTNGFGGSKSDFSTLGPTYAKRGYAFFAYSGLGFGNSGCKITLDDPDYDGKAGSQLLSFLGGTKAAKDGTKIDYIVKDGPGDPRVGMIGGSYGGQIQFAIAGLDRRLDTIVPQITWNDLSYSLTPNNTDFKTGVTYSTPGVAKSDWPVLFTALGLEQGFQQAVQNQDPSHLGACPNFSDQVCTSLVTSASLGYPDAATLALLRHASVASYISRIRIPTFLAQGQSDTLFDLQEVVATYKSLRAQGTPVKMLWRSSGHSGGSIPGESSSSNPESAYESRLELQWFDYYLRHIGPRPGLDLSFLRDWVKYSGDAAPAVAVTPRYPAGPEQTVFLSGTNQLVPTKTSVSGGAASFAAVPGATGSGGSFTQVPGADAPGTFAAYETGPLADKVDIVGIPRLTVKLDAPVFAQSQSQDPGAELVLFAKLLDVDENGNATLPRNQLSAVRVGDVTKPVEIQLPGIVHRFEKGHRMRLVVTTSNATNHGNNVAGPVSIVTNPGAPGTLTLPKLGAGFSTVPGRCLSARSPIGPRNIGRVRLGYTRSRLLRIPVRPVRRTSRTYRYCVKGRSGAVTAVFSSRSRRGRVSLVTTTARGHGNRNVRVSSRASRFRRAYPRRRAVGRGLFRASPRSPRLIGVRGGRVTFIGVVNGSLLRHPQSLRRYLRLAGVRPR